MKPAPPPSCRECGILLSKVSPRRVIRVTREAKTGPGKAVHGLLGTYCGTTCAFDAYTRGIPKH